MRTILMRPVASVAAITCSMVIVIGAIAPLPAHASVETEADTFVMTVFPHETSSVNFWDSWGARRPGGRRHRGTDIMGPKGSEVLAVADGVVTDFGYQRLSGFYVRLDHGSGWSTTYMHLNNDTEGTDDGLGGLWTAVYPTLTIGAPVVAGQVIGYVGDSGNAEGTQPHIHVDVKRDGVKVNPYPYLKEAFDRQTLHGCDAITISIDSQPPLPC